ncbi:DNA-directed RNA polymerase III subunit RPC7 [Senna tora]|uniref:DNA-directed RNA polymerase III subunit RPC7 n=1 Tax=Senna tora TaxID=362788 RepID=A0A834XFG8_9FABA|nr:DNA-directed RNA polymerase III subunit RPC7 [Senna tora]
MSEFRASCIESLRLFVVSRRRRLFGVPIESSSLPVEASPLVHCCTSGDRRRCFSTLTTSQVSSKGDNVVSKLKKNFQSSKSIAILTRQKMAYRGRGRGRGFGGWGGGHSFAKQEPFVLFPEDVVLPNAKVDDIDISMKRLLNWNNKLQNYWKASPYHLEDTSSKKSQSLDVEKFSDKRKTVFTRDSLSQVLVFNDFPKELIQGTTRGMPKRKKFRWNPESDLKTLDLFEQLEKKAQIPYYIWRQFIIYCYWDSL